MPPPTARRLIAACAAAAMTLLAGCAVPAGDTPSSHTPSAPQALRAAATALLAPPSFDEAATGNTEASGAAPADLLPGLYALDRLAVDVNGNTVVFRAQRPCSEVLDELQAGQWTARIIPAMDNPLSATMAVLSYGDRMAMAYLKGSDASCVGSVTAGSPVDVTAGGALTATGAGMELPLYCHVGPNPGGNDPKDLLLTYFGLFTTASESFVVMGAAPANVGSHQLAMDEEGSQGITVMPLKPDVLPIDAAVTFLGTFFAGQGDPESTFAQFTGMFAGGGTIDVTSSSPLEATLTTDTLAAYVDDADDDDDSENDSSGYDADGNPVESDEDGENDDGVVEKLGAAAGQSLTLTAPLHCAQ